MEVQWASELSGKAPSVTVPVILATIYCLQKYWNLLLSPTRVLKEPPVKHQGGNYAIQPTPKLCENYAKLCEIMRKLCEIMRCISAQKGLCQNFGSQNQKKFFRRLRRQIAFFCWILLEQGWKPGTSLWLVFLWEGFRMLVDFTTFFMIFL